MATTTIAMPQPPGPATHRITHIIDLLDSRRTRIASLRLLSLDREFLNDLAATGDLTTLAQIGSLFQCLIETPYVCGFSKPVDRAITKLLLHAIKGCEGRLSRLRAQHAHDRLCWLLPSEVEAKEILEVYRGFLHYITCQYNSLSPVKDPSLTEAKRKLQKLCPRINNLSSSLSPTREMPRRFWVDSPATRLRSNHGTPSTGISKSRTPRASMRNTKAPTPALALVSKPNAKALKDLKPVYITPPDTIPTCEDHLTVPTLKLSRDPKLRVSIPRRSQRKFAAQLRVVDGMVEAVTQPFTSNVCNDSESMESKDAAVKADAQLKREYAEWRERHLRPFLRLSPEATPDRWLGRDCVVAGDNF
jgi:hypothetical protein